MVLTASRRFKKAKHVRSKFVDDGSRPGDSEEETMDGSESDGFVASEDSVDYHTDAEPTEEDRLNLAAGKDYAEQLLEELRMERCRVAALKKKQRMDMELEVLQEHKAVTQRQRQRKRLAEEDDDDDEQQDADELATEIKARSQMDSAASKELKELLRNAHHTAMTAQQASSSESDFAVDEQVRSHQVESSSLASSDQLQKLSAVDSGHRLKQSFLTGHPPPSVTTSGKKATATGKGKGKANKAVPPAAPSVPYDPRNALHLPPGQLSNWGLGQYFDFTYPSTKQSIRFIITYFSDAPIPTGSTNNDILWKALRFEHVSTAKVVDSQPPIYESFILCEGSSTPHLISSTHGRYMVGAEEKSTQLNIKQAVLSHNNMLDERLIVPTIVHKELLNAEQAANEPQVVETSDHPAQIETTPVATVTIDSSVAASKSASSIASQLLEFIFDTMLEALSADDLVKLFHTESRDLWQLWGAEAQQKVSEDNSSQHWQRELWQRVSSEYEAKTKENPQLFRRMLLQIYPMLIPSANRKLEQAIKRKRSKKAKT